MIRRSPSPGFRPALLAALLASVLGLGGCAAQPAADAASRDTAEPAEAYTRLGVAYLERNNLPRALSALNRALELDADDAEARQALAMVYQRQGETTLADQSFRQALDADPTLTRARNNYAAFLYDQGRIREACDQLERAAEDTRYVNREQLFTNLGQCHRELGDIAAARRSLERAQSIDPRRPGSYFRLAELEYHQGNYARAEQQLESFMRLAGPVPAAHRLARDIARARDDQTTAAFHQDRLESARGTP